MAMETSKSSKTEAILDLYDALRHGERVQRQDWCQEHGLTTKTFERYMANLRDHLYEKICVPDRGRLLISIRKRRLTALPVRKIPGFPTVSSLPSARFS